MKQRRRDAVAGVVGGLLVVAGGYCGHTELTAVEAYTGTGWISLPPLPHAVWAATGCVLNGRLHVIGGRDSNKLQVLEMTEKHGPCYMEHGWSWSCKAELPALRDGAASVVHNGRIWVMGGNEGADRQPSESTITYDAEADTWETAPPLPYSPMGVTFCRAARTEGGIISLYHMYDPGAGGSGPDPGVTHSCRVLQYRNAAWSQPTELPVPTAATAAVCGSVLLG